MKLRLPLLLASLLLSAMATGNRAGGYTWTGSQSNQWNTSGNWDPQGVPGGNPGRYDTADFHNTLDEETTSILLGGTTRLNRLTSTVDDQKILTLSGSGSSLSFGGSGSMISLNGNMTLNLNTAVYATSNLDIVSQRSNLAFGNMFSGGGHDLSVDVDAGSRVEMRGTTSSIAHLVKNGAGTLVLAADNSNINGITIHEGALHLGTNRSLGGASLVIGEAANRNRVVSLQAVTGDLVLANEFSWLNSNLNITGQYRITMAPSNQVAIELNGDRTIDTEINASLVFSNRITTTGSGGLTKSGLGRFIIEGADHSFNSLSVRDGIVGVEAKDVDYILGARAQAGEGTPLGTGPISIIGDNSKLELSPGTGMSIFIAGSISLDRGGVFELMNATTTRLSAGAVLDGGTSVAGNPTLFLLRGDVHLDAGTLLNTPDVRLGTSGTLYGSGITGSFGTMTFGIGSGTDRFTLDGSATGLSAEMLSVSDQASLLFNADNHFRASAWLVLGKASVLETNGFSAGFSDLAWTNSTVWEDRSTIILSGGAGSGTGILHFAGNSLTGGNGTLMFDGWDGRFDTILFDHDISNDTWYNRIRFLGYNDELGLEVVTHDGKYELRPFEVANEGIYIWTGKAYLGEGIGKSTNTDASLGGNWNANRIPYGTGSEIVFSNLDNSLSGKTIRMDTSPGLAVIGKLRIDDNVTGAFRMAGPVAFDNGSSQAGIHLGSGNYVFGIINDIYLNEQGLMFTGLNGRLQLYGDIHGTGNLTVTGESGILELRRKNNVFEGDVILESGNLVLAESGVLGTGKLIVNGGALGQTGANVSISNQLIINNDFTLAKGTIHFLESGAPGTGSIMLDRVYNITGEGALQFHAGRDLQGDGGFVLGPPRGGTISITSWSSNADFKGGIVLNNNTLFTVNATGNGNGSAHAIVFGEEQANANYGGTGDITFATGGNFYIRGDAETTVDFRGGMSVSSRNSATGVLWLQGNLAAVKFTDVNFGGAVNINAYGSQNLEFGRVTFLNPGKSSLSLSMASRDSGSVEGDTTVASLDGQPTSIDGLNRLNVSGMGYTATLDDSIEYLSASTVYLSSGRLKLTRDNQIRGLSERQTPALTLGSGSILASQGVENRFGALTITGASTIELGSGGQLTFDRIASWSLTGGLPHLLNIENASGVWNTVSSLQASSEHIWFLTASALSAQQLSQVAFTGYTRGAVLYYHESLDRWELLPDGDLAFEWIGGGGNRSWSSSPNWFGGNIPNAPGSIAIFRDQDTLLDQKTILLTGDVTVSQINFEGAKSTQFTIASASSDPPEKLTFKGRDGDPARINMTGAMSPDINADIAIGPEGLLVNHSAQRQTLTLSGQVRDETGGISGPLILEGPAGQSDLNVLSLQGNNTFSGGVVQRGGTLEITHDNALGSGSYTVEGEARFGGRDLAGYATRTVSNDLHLHATNSDDKAWTLTSKIIFDDNNDRDTDGYLYGPVQIIAFGQNGQLTFGANYTLADADGNTPSQLELKSASGWMGTIRFLGQNTFSGGVAISGKYMSSIEIGSSSILNNPASPEEGLLSGPLGTGTAMLGASDNHVLGIVNRDGSSADHYTLHNTITAGNAGQLNFYGGSGSLTLDSHNTLEFGNIDRVIYTGMSSMGSQRATMLVINSLVDAGEASVAVRGDEYVRLSNSDNNFSEFNIGLKQYSNGSGAGRVSIGADNALGSNSIGVYAWTGATTSAQSYLQAYSGEEGQSTRILNNMFEFHAGLVFSGLIEQGGIAGGEQLDGVITLAMNGTGASDLNADGHYNQRTWTINSSSIPQQSGQYNSVIVSWADTHDIANGGLLVNGNLANYQAILAGKGGGLELLGTKTFSGNTNDGSGNRLLGAGYDSNSANYALVLGNYGLVATTLTDRDMVIGGLADGNRVTPFGQGEILLDGQQALLIVHTGDNNRNVYLEDGLFEIARGTFEVTGGGSLILGRKGDGTSFDQALAGRGGQNGQGLVTAGNGSRIIVDSGDKTVSLRANLGGDLTLLSGTLTMSMGNALNNVTDLTFNGGTLNLNRLSQSLANGATLTLGSSSMSTLDFGGLASTGNVVLTAGSLGTWDAKGTLIIKNWQGNIAGGGRSRLVLGSHTAGDPMYIGNISFDGYSTGARIVLVDGNYEILPYAATYIWKGAEGNSWDDQGNWKEGQVPNIINASVTFGDEALATSTTAVLNADRTVGDLKFTGTQSQHFEIAGAAAGMTLVMAQTPESGFDAAIELSGNSGALISTNIRIDNNLNISTGEDTELELTGTVFHNSDLTYGIRKNGSGTLTLSGNSTFNGGFALNEGRLRINREERMVNDSLASGAVGTGTFTIAGGTIEAVGQDRRVSNEMVMNGYFTVDGSHAVILDRRGGGSRITGDIVITVTDDASLAIGANNIFSCNGKITKEGLGLMEWRSILDTTLSNGVRINNGTLVLSANNNYSGGTEMAGGILAIVQNTSLGNADSTIDILGNSTLRIDADLTGVANSFRLADGHVLTIQTEDGKGSSTNAVLNGGMSGTGDLSKTGAGILTLTGRHDFSGTASVAEGTLQIGNGGAGTTFAADTTLAAGTHLVFNNGDVLAYGETITGDGDLTKRGNGRLVLSGDNTFGGGTSLESGTLTVAHDKALGGGDLAMDNATVLDFGDGISLANRITINGTGRLNVDIGTGTQQGIIAGNNLEKSGLGKLVLTADNAYLGATVILGGELQIGNGGVTGSIGAMNDAARFVYVNTDAALAFNRSDDIIHLGTISGGGQLVQRGTGTLLVTSAQRHAGGSVVERGVLKIRDGGSLDGFVNIQEHAAFHIGQQAGDYILANNLTGSGTLIVNLSEDENHLTANNMPHQFSFGNEALLRGDAFSGTVEMRRVAYIIDEQAELFMNGNSVSGLRTATGSIGSLQTSTQQDPGRRNRTLEGTVEFAGGEMTWDFDEDNNADAYLQAGAISITATTGFNLNLNSSANYNTGHVSFFTGTRDHILGISSETITGTEQWSWGRLSVGGVAQPDTSAVRQGITQSGEEIARGIFSWEALTKDGTMLIARDRLATVEIFKDRTLSVVHNSSDGNNELATVFTDYTRESLLADGNDAAHTGRVGPGNISFTDATKTDGINLTGPNSYTGTTTIHADTRLILGCDSALGNPGRHTAAIIANDSGAVLDLAAHTGHAGSVMIGNGGNIHLGQTGTGTLVITDNDEPGTTPLPGGGTIAGDDALTGTGNIRLELGTLVISGSNENVEALSLVGTDATLLLTHVNALGKSEATAGTITVYGTLQLQAGGTLDNIIAGAEGGTWEKLGSDRLVSARDNTFAGTVAVREGTLALTGSNSAFGLVILDNGATLELGRGNSAGNSLISMSAESATIRALDNLTWNNKITIGSTRGTIDTNGFTVTGGDTIGGAGDLVISGLGVLRIGTAGTYGGNTFITGGSGTDDSTGTRVILNEGGHGGLSAGLVTLEGHSTLELAFSNHSFTNRLAGAVTETVSVGGGNVTLDADNNEFEGTWDITGSALVSGTIGNPGISGHIIDNIGRNSAVFLNGGSLTLNGTDSGDETLAFGNTLAGYGTLNVLFGKETSLFAFAPPETRDNGHQFDGVLNMRRGTYLFSIEDQSGTGVLAAGTLKLSTSAGGHGIAVIDGDYRIGALVMDGGTLNVDTTGQGKPKGVLTVGDLDVAGGGTIAMRIPGSINITEAKGTLFDDGHDVDPYQFQVVRAEGSALPVHGAQLTFTNHDGSVTGSPNIRQYIQLRDAGNAEIAEAVYDYTMTVKTDAAIGLGENGIYLGYGLSRINSYTDGALYQLANTETSSQVMGTRLTSTARGAEADAASLDGGFDFHAFDSADHSMIIANAANNYSGRTLVSSGRIIYGANNAFGRTRELELAAKTIVDMNGKTQTGDVNAIGKLTMTNPGASLLVNGGQLEVRGPADIDNASLSLGNSSGRISITGASAWNNQSVFALQGGAASLGGNVFIGQSSRVAMEGGNLDIRGALITGGGSTIDLGLAATGTLSLSGGGSITGDSALSGNGQLILAGTDATMAIDGANTELTASVDIRDTNTVRTNDFNGLGSGSITLDGNLSITGASQGNLSNVVNIGTVSGSGTITLTNSNGTQTGQFTGRGAAINLIDSVLVLDGDNSGLGTDSAFTIGKNSVLTASKATHLGGSALRMGGLARFDVDGTDIWTVVNVLADHGADAGAILKTGSGTVAVNHANDRTGITTVADGKLSLGHVLAAGSGDVSITGKQATFMLAGNTTGTFANRVTNNGHFTIAGNGLELSGAIDGNGTVNFLDGAVVTLSGDNRGFDGTAGAHWHAFQGAAVRITDASNLGTTADILLNGTLTLDRPVEAETGSYQWENALSGHGALIVSLSSGREEFLFGGKNAARTGAGYHGTLKLELSTFRLDGNTGHNSTALTNATLEMAEGNRTIVERHSGINSLGGLTLNGGVLDFSCAQHTGAHTGTTTDHISIADGMLTVTGGTVMVEAGLLNGIDTTVDTTANILTHEDPSMLFNEVGRDFAPVKLVEASAGHARGGMAALEVVDNDSGAIIPMDDTEQVVALKDGDDIIAKGHYNYGTTLGAERDGLYVGYILLQIDIENGRTLVLDNEDAVGAAADLCAKITGDGHLTIHASGVNNKVISLSHGGNTFTGITRVTDGTTLRAETTIDHIISESSRLVLGSGSTFDMNGTNQKINCLSGAGQIRFNGTGILETRNKTGADSIYRGDILGEGAMVKTGEGTLTLHGGSIHHAGGTTVEEGAMHLQQASAHASGTLATVKDDSRLTVDGGTIGSGGDTLFAAEGSRGAIRVGNITEYAVGRDGQKILDARGEGDMEFSLDNVSNARGNVYAETEAKVRMALKNGTGFTGKIDPVSLTVDTTSTWNMTADSTVTDLRTSGTIDFVHRKGEPFKTLSVQGDMSNESGGPGTFRMGVDLADMKSDLVTVAGGVSGSYLIAIKRDQLNDTTDAARFSLKLIDVGGQNEGMATGETSFRGSTDVRMRKASVQAGDLDGNSPEDWFLVYDAAADPGEGLGNTGKSILGMSEISLLWFTQMDTLVRRMGELRMNRPLGGKWVDNVWVRSYGSQYNVDSRVIGSGYRDYVYGADLGVDHGWQLDRFNRIYTGAFAGYGGDRKDFKEPGTKGDTDSFYFGTYGTWINDCGCYVDLVVKAQHLYNDFRSYDDSFNRTSGNYNQWALGASLEAGKMFKFGNNWFIEPQAQVNYFHAIGTDYRTAGANPFKADVAGTDVLNFRYGVNVGRTYSLGDNGMLQPYVRVEGIHQFSRGGHVRTEDGQWRARMNGSTFRVGTGLIWQINERNQIHLGYDAAFGENYTMPWGINAGYRYQF